MPNKPYSSLDPRVLLPRRKVGSPSFSPPCCARARCFRSGCVIADIDPLGRHAERLSRIELRNIVSVPGWRGQRRGRHGSPPSRSTPSSRNAREVDVVKRSTGPTARRGTISSRCRTELRRRARDRVASDGLPALPVRHFTVWENIVRGDEPGTPWNPVVGSDPPFGPRRDTASVDPSARDDLGLPEARPRSSVLPSAQDHHFTTRPRSSCRTRSRAVRLDARAPRGVATALSSPTSLRILRFATRSGESGRKR